MTDPRYWAWWQDKLAGVEVPASEGTPYAGFYRWVRKEHYGAKKYAIPVAYWPGDNGELHCRVGFKDVTPQHGRDIWVNVCEHPVYEEWYREVTEKVPPEKTWRDGLDLTPPPAPTPPETIKDNPLIGDNLPPADNDFNWLKEQIEQAAEPATERLKGPAITTQLEADQIANMADKLAELWKAAENARKGERKPHDEALVGIQRKWSPVLALAETYKDLKYKLLTPWQLAQEQAQQQEAAAAEAAGEAPPSEPRRPRAGTRGRAMTLKSTKSAKITDFAACLEHFKESPDIRATVQDLANKAVRVGLTVPGVEVQEEKRTV